MPNDILTKYGAQQTLTAAVASLASDTNLLAGLETSIIDNTTDGWDDIILSGFLTTGSGTLVVNRSIEVWAVAWNGSGWPDVFDGTTSSETINSADIKNSICKPVAIMNTSTTNDRRYDFTGVSARQVFGGVLPSKFVLFITQSTGQNLNSTAGNHALYYEGVKPQVQ